MTSLALNNWAQIYKCVCEREIWEYWNLLIIYIWEGSLYVFVCLCWGFTAQSIQWGHVERGQFT